MKKYVKPSINVIELQLKENIAAVPTTVYKGVTKEAAVTAQKKVQMLLSKAGTGMENEYIIS